MPRGRRDAESKFWRTPELVEKLLPFLCVCSVERLAECHDLTRGLLQSPFAWNKFIRRSISKATIDSTTTWWEEEDVEVQEMLDRVKILARILRMLELEDSKPLLLDLLHLICEKHPLISFVKEGHPGHWNWMPGQELVAVSCSCNQTHSVSPLGFLLLDAVEATVGTTEQTVEKVEVHHLAVILPTLIRRVVQQEEMVGVVQTGIFSCMNKEMAEAFYALAQNCQTLLFPTLLIQHEIGEDGWTAIRKAIQHLGRIVPRYDIMASKKAMVGGRREDLKAIWDNLNFWGSWLLLEFSSHTVTHLESWEMLEDILDTGEGQVNEDQEAEAEPGD